MIGSLGDCTYRTCIGEGRQGQGRLSASINSLGVEAGSGRPGAEADWRRPEAARQGGEAEAGRPSRDETTIENWRRNEESMMFACRIVSFSNCVGSARNKPFFSPNQNRNCAPAPIYYFQKK